jgi:hypothetical protein
MPPEVGGGDTISTVSATSWTKFVSENPVTPWRFGGSEGIRV